MFAHAKHATTMLGFLGCCQGRAVRLLRCSAWFSVALLCGCWDVRVQYESKAQFIVYKVQVGRLGKAKTKV